MEVAILTVDANGAECGAAQLAAARNEQLGERLIDFNAVGVR